MNRLNALVIAPCVAIALAALPALAQQGAPQGSADHGANHGAAAQQAPGSGMGQGGMGQGGMMGQSGCPVMGGMMGPGMGRGMMGSGAGMMMGGGPMMGMMMGTGPMMEGRLAYLKAELGITDDQTAAWDGYVDAVKARHAAMQDMHAGMMKAMQSGNAMDRLDAHIKAMESMVESLKALRPATVALYAVLNDEQKKKADLLLSGGCGMM